MQTYYTLIASPTVESSGTQTLIIIVSKTAQTSGFVLEWFLQKYSDAKKKKEKKILKRFIKIHNPLS